MVAAATYRQREVEDEDEEAVHDESSAEWAGGASGGRRVGDPSHTQTCRSPPASRPAEPALPALGATPPAARERWRDREEAGLVVGGWVVLVWHGSGSLDRSVCLPLCGAEVAWRSAPFIDLAPGAPPRSEAPCPPLAVQVQCSAGAASCPPRARSLGPGPSGRLRALAARAFVTYRHPPPLYISKKNSGSTTPLDDRDDKVSFTPGLAGS